MTDKQILIEFLRERFVDMKPVGTHHIEGAKYYAEKEFNKSVNSGTLTRIFRDLKEFTVDRPSEFEKSHKIKCVKAPKISRESYWTLTTITE